MGLLLLLLLLPLPPLLLLLGWVGQGRGWMGGAKDIGDAGQVGNGVEGDGIGEK
jgi:hypothetical protein